MAGALLIIIGIFIMAMTFIKPNLYWNGARTLKLRKRFGDAMANIIYILIAIMFVFLGVTMI
jgi:hypothetical protein